MFAFMVYPTIAVTFRIFFKIISIKLKNVTEMNCFIINPENTSTDNLIYLLTKIKNYLIM